MHAVVHLENLHFALVAHVVALRILQPGARTIRRKALIRWELLGGRARPLVGRETRRASLTGPEVRELPPGFARAQPPLACPKSSVRALAFL